MAWTWSPPKNNMTTGQTGIQTPGRWYWSGNPNNIDFGSKPTQPPPHARPQKPGTNTPPGTTTGVTTVGRIPGPYPFRHGTPIRIYGGTVPKGLKSSNAPPNKMYPVTKRIRTMQTRIFGHGHKPGQRGISGHFPKQMKTYIGLTKRGGIGLKKYGGLTPGNLSIPGVKGPRGSLTNLTPKFGGDPKMRHKLGLLPWVPGKVGKIRGNSSTGLGSRKGGGGTKGTNTGRPTGGADVGCVNGWPERQADGSWKCVSQEASGGSGGQDGSTSSQVAVMSEDSSAMQGNSLIDEEPWQIAEEDAGAISDEGAY